MVPTTAVMGSLPGTCTSSTSTLVGSRPASIKEGKKPASLPEEKDVEKAVEQSPLPAVVAKEGGREAYLSVFGSCCILFACFGLSNAYGVLQAQFHSHLLPNESQSNISWIGSLHLCILFTGALPSGRLYDLGYFRYQLAVGSLLWVAGLCGLSFARTYPAFLVCWGIVMGVGAALCFAPVFPLIGGHFKAKRGSMLGLAAATSALGTVIYPIVINNLVPKIGFPNTVRVAMSMSGLLLLVANFVCTPAARRAGAPAQPPPMLPLLKKVLQDRPTQLVCVASFAVMTGYFIPPFYIQVYSQSKGAAASLAPYTISILNAAAIPGRFLPGLLSDRLGVFNTALPFCFFTGALIFCMLAAVNTASTIVFAILYGLFSGGWMALSGLIYMSLAEDVSELGVRSGLAFGFIGLASLVGPPISGALINATGGNYYATCGWGGGVVILGTVILAGARQLQARRSGSWRV